MTYKRKERWTANQINFLKDNWKTMNDDEIASVIGRTRKSIRHKRQRLGLEKVGLGRGVFDLKKD